MELVLDLLQGAGIAAAIGIRPFLPVLLVGALASADVGLDFDGTSLSFLEQWPFLLGVVVAVAVLDLLARRTSPGPRSPLTIVLGLLAIALGALEGAGSLADRGHPEALGAVVGALCALLGFVAAASLLGRVRRRLDAEAQGALFVYAEGAAVAAAGLSVLFPPLAILVVIGLVFLLVGGRRRQGEKYAGLRILR